MFLQQIKKVYQNFWKRKILKRETIIFPAFQMFSLQIRYSYYSVLQQQSILSD